MLLFYLIGGFGVFIIVTGKCTISKRATLTGKGARLLGVALIAMGLNLFDLIARPIANLFGPETTAGVLVLFGVRIAILVSIAMLLLKKYGSAAQPDPDAKASSVPPDIH